MKAVERSNVSENSVSGFRACGLVPFNPSVIKKDRFLGSGPSDESETTLDLPPAEASVPQVSTPEPQFLSLKGAYKAGFMAARNHVLQIYEAFLPNDLLDL